MTADAPATVQPAATDPSPEPAPEPGSKPGPASGSDPTPTAAPAIKPKAKAKPAARRMRNGVMQRVEGGPYYYVIRVGGKQKWVKGGRTRKEAEAARREALSQQLAGAYIAPSKLTVRGYLTSWLETQKDLIRESTWDLRNQHVTIRLIPTLGDHRLQALAATDLDDAFRKIAAEHGFTMMEAAHATLRKALNDAYRKDLIATNPIGKVDLPRRPERTFADGEDHDDDALPHVVWDLDQTGAFLAWLGTQPDRRDLTLWELLAFTGVRRGEALGLTWRDLDLEAGRLWVRRQFTPKKRVAPTKTDESVRDFALDSVTIDALRRYKREQAEERLRLGLGRSTGQTPVFTRPDGTRLRPNTVSVRFPRLVARCNKARAAQGLPPLPLIKVHDLRHTAATMMLDAGIDVRAVARRLGHANASITMRVYAAWLPNADEAAAEAFGKYLNGGTVAAAR